MIWASSPPPIVKPAATARATDWGPVTALNADARTVTSPRTPPAQMTWTGALGRPGRRERAWSIWLPSAASPPSANRAGVPTPALATSKATLTKAALSP